MSIGRYSLLGLPTERTKDVVRFLGGASPVENLGSLALTNRFTADLCRAEMFKSLRLPGCKGLTVTTASLTERINDAIAFLTDPKCSIPKHVRKLYAVLDHVHTGDVSPVRISVDIVAELICSSTLPYLESVFFHNAIWLDRPVSSSQTKPLPPCPNVTTILLAGFVTSTSASRAPLDIISVAHSLTTLSIHFHSDLGGRDARAHLLHYVSLRISTLALTNVRNVHLPFVEALIAACRISLCSLTFGLRAEPLPCNPRSPVPLTPTLPECPCLSKLTIFIPVNDYGSKLPATRMGRALLPLLRAPPQSLPKLILLLDCRAPNFVGLIPRDTDLEYLVANLPIHAWHRTLTEARLPPTKIFFTLWVDPFPQYRPAWFNIITANMWWRTLPQLASNPFKAELTVTTSSPVIVALPPA